MWKKYPNQFARIGVSGEQVRARVEACFETLFFDPEEKIYHDVDPDSGRMVDTGNDDARTEGMKLWDDDARADEPQGSVR